MEQKKENLSQFPKQKIKRRNRDVGITKKDFHAILDKASQPIKREAQSDSEKTET
jgi:hypothetical protein